MAVDDLRGRRLGGFELIEPLGAGSFGSVWRAYQLRLDREVAVKVLDPLVARDPVVARRFDREGRAAASLDHPAIVPVYEAGDSDGLYYLAMRLVDGETLDDVIEREAPLDRARVAELLGPIADALDAAHAIDLIHRDVKPANILLENGRPYLTDFGIAASARELGRYTTGTIGSAEYMAPEQGRGDDVDHRADLYALACVAYHAMTGRSPFARDDMVSTLVAHADAEIPSTGDDDLDAFFATALAKAPDDRFGSGAELMAALRGDAAIPPSPAGRPGPSGSSGSGGRRGMVVGIVAAVVVLAVVGGLVLTSGGGDDEPDAEPAPATSVIETEHDGDAGSGGDESSDGGSDDGTVIDGDDGDDEPEGAATETTIVEPPSFEVLIGGSVNVGTTLDFTDPNPHSSLDVSKVVSEWVLPVMYRIDENLDPVPSLAAGPPQALGDDPNVLTWSIRGDRTWNDGSPVTTSDVTATWEYLSAADTNAQSLALYDSVASVTAIDTTTLEITVTEPVGAAHLWFSTIHPIIQRDAWDAHLGTGGTAADFLDEPFEFAAGPFQLASRQVAGEIVLVPNPEYTGDDATVLDRVDFATYTDSPELVEAQLGGEVDMIWVEDVVRSELRDLDGVDGVATAFGTSNVGIQLTFNTAPGRLLADPELRRAITLAIDRENVIASTSARQNDRDAEPWDSLVFAPDQHDGDGAFPATGRGDPDAAAALLDDLGWEQLPIEDGARRLDGVDLILDVVLVDSPDYLSANQQVRSDLFDAAIGTTSDNLTLQEYDERIINGDFDIALQPRIINNDPIAVMFNFASDQCPAPQGCPADGVNIGRFADSDTDALLARADAETDPDVRFDVYAQLDARLAETFAALPLWIEPAFIAHDDDLTGIELAPNIGPLTSLSSWARIAR